MSELSRETTPIHVIVALAPTSVSSMSLLWPAPTEFALETGPCNPLASPYSFRFNYPRLSTEYSSSCLSPYSKVVLSSASFIFYFLKPFLLHQPTLILLLFTHLHFSSVLSLKITRFTVLNWSIGCLLALLLISFSFSSSSLSLYKYCLI